MNRYNNNNNNKLIMNCLLAEIPHIMPASWSGELGVSIHACAATLQKLHGPKRAVIKSRELWSTDEVLRTTITVTFTKKIQEEKLGLTRNSTYKKMCIHNF